MAWGLTPKCAVFHKGPKAKKRSYMSHTRLLKNAGRQSAIATKHQRKAKRINLWVGRSRTCYAKTILERNRAKRRAAGLPV